MVVADGGNDGPEVDVSGCCGEPAKGAEELVVRSIKKEWKNKNLFLERKKNLEKPRL